MNVRIDPNYIYFEKNLPDFLKEHKDEFVLISNQKVIGFFKDMNLALNEAKRKYASGEFIIQPVLEGSDSIQKYRSRVVFH